jgi:hypothetical protein
MSVDSVLLAIQSASTGGGASAVDLAARFGGGEGESTLRSILDSLALDGHVYCADGKYMAL